uniref:Putative ovule protein n=2 Tax=Solanum TaxID=4107 RepID=A0A0V0GW50_SOLCH
MHENLLRKSMTKLISASVDFWMGTELLFTDVSDALELLIKQLKGRQLTKRERKKMKRTLGDIATLVPITILMLIPVSAVGHAAMLAAIKKYVPSLIPSPFSFERLDLMKQLKRTKKKEVQARSSIDNPSSKVVE